MKEIFDFIEENVLGIFLGICLIGFTVLVIILDFQVSKKDLYDLEKSCFEFYQENNYILEECSKYKEKLEGANDDKE